MLCLEYTITTLGQSTLKKPKSQKLAFGFNGKRISLGLL